MKKAVMASVIVMAMDGTTVSMGRCPPRSALGARLDELAPKITSNAVGSTIVIRGPTNSRAFSFSSTAVSLVRADISSRAPSVVERAAGERDERVVQARLLHAQVGG